jgi:hypothetical protein
MAAQKLNGGTKRASSDAYKTLSATAYKLRILKIPKSSVGQQANASPARGVFNQQGPEPEPEPETEL